MLLALNETVLITVNFVKLLNDNFFFNYLSISDLRKYTFLYNIKIK